MGVEVPLHVGANWGCLCVGTHMICVLTVVVKQKIVSGCVGEKLMENETFVGAIGKT